MHCVKAPRLAAGLQSLLIPVGAGLLVGEITRRVADTVVERVDEEIGRQGGRATVITQDNTPQGFTVREFGHQRVREIDGLQLARIRLSEKKIPHPQEKSSEVGHIV